MPTSLHVQLLAYCLDTAQQEGSGYVATLRPRFVKRSRVAVVRKHLFRLGGAQGRR